MLGAFKHYVNSSTVNDFGNIHKFIWGNRFFQITFYSSPEECGYYSALPNYEELRYVLCHIEEMSNCKTKYELYFGFDLDNMTFLELFDANYHVSDIFIRMSKEKYINFIEAQLRNTVLN